MSIITLTTDFGTKDHFVGAIKGTIYSELPDARIVDISHQISPFNITQTAYILKNAYKSFPEGSIHIIGVDSELNDENKHIALKLDNHYFICPDNGVISLLASEIKPEKIVEINIHDRVSTSFPVLDVFVKVACHIARGGTLEIIGKIISEFKQLVELQPTVSSDKNTINGNIIYVDNYGNSISNISHKLFQEIGKGRRFEVIANKYIFKKIYKKYSDIIDFSLPKEQRQKDGSRMAIFNTANYLEIAMYRSNSNTVGSAFSLLGLNYRDIITIKFNDN
ncbi:MAG: SAM-dependent chlorinase/fluorinase [Lutibacter sp.]|uniref:SAM hydrolase/SAM-dependent halogenase family protein n=1 Tax=Lutibacter sp. TaxID=1925666 RepID=UPI00182767C0|nr:SAM-dependent chlorinase/fluorinase [Lutibacter sp.]MBT8318132.1 SAM-dependent chlorinase/fluorinase [Lutibacter sp.]NNJ58992.1 SAM-dependent chlorinase/fluorinase [Lutibacter sp.]